MEPTYEQLLADFNADHARAMRFEAALRTIEAMGMEHASCVCTGASDLAAIAAESLAVKA